MLKSPKKEGIELIENPAQQVQMQKGEQASSCGSSWGADLINEEFWASSLAMEAPSAQGIMLKDRTRIAIMKARTFFTGAKVGLDTLKGKIKIVSKLQASLFC